MSRPLFFLCIVFLAEHLIFSVNSFAGPCKRDDFEECSGHLDRLAAGKAGGAVMSDRLDQICADSKSFHCEKVTVRGDVAQELELERKEHPKAHLYKIKIQDEHIILILEPKAEPPSLAASSPGLTSGNSPVPTGSKEKLTEHTETRESAKPPSMNPHSGNCSCESELRALQGQVTQLSARIKALEGKVK